MAGAWGVRHYAGGFGFRGMMGRHTGRMGMGFRRFIARDEVIARLDDYLKELQAKVKAVQERIDELKKKGEPD